MPGLHGVSTTARSSTRRRAGRPCTRPHLRAGQAQALPRSGTARGARQAGGCSMAYEPDGHAEHAVIPLAFTNQPASQLARPAQPRAAQCLGCMPSLQWHPQSRTTQLDRVHCVLSWSPVALLNEPERHGSMADAPSGQYEPAAQSEHAVAPVSLMNLPASQVAQSAAGGHARARAARLANQGARRARRASRAASARRRGGPSTLLKVPAKHGKAADAPSTQCRPATHSWQCSLPLSFMDLPASHLSRALIGLRLHRARAALLGSQRARRARRA